MFLVVLFSLLVRSAVAYDDPLTDPSWRAVLNKIALDPSLDGGYQEQERAEDAQLLALDYRAGRRRASARRYRRQIAKRRHYSVSRHRKASSSGQARLFLGVSMEKDFHTGIDCSLPVYETKKNTLLIEGSGRFQNNQGLGGDGGFVFRSLWKNSFVVGGSALIRASGDADIRGGIGGELSFPGWSFSAKILSPIAPFDPDEVGVGLEIFFPGYPQLSVAAGSSWWRDTDAEQATPGGKKRSQLINGSTFLVGWRPFAALKLLIGHAIMPDNQSDNLAVIELHTVLGRPLKEMLLPVSAGGRHAKNNLLQTARRAFTDRDFGQFHKKRHRGADLGTDQGGDQGTDQQHAVNERNAQSGGLWWARPGSTPKLMKFKLTNATPGSEGEPETAPTQGDQGGGIWFTPPGATPKLLKFKLKKITSARAGVRTRSTPLPNKVPKPTPKKAR